jgi:hypothetical protein
MNCARYENRTRAYCLGSNRSATEPISQVEFVRVEGISPYRSSTGFPFSQKDILENMGEPFRFPLGAKQLAPLPLLLLRNPWCG